MSTANPVIRTANQLSLAAWFGGSLMGLVGVPRAGQDGDGATTEAEGRAWSAWQPVQAGAIASQLASGAALTVVNRGRLVSQRGVARTSIIRTVLTGAAIGATALAARSGRRLEAALDGAAPTDDEPRPDGASSPDGGQDVRALLRRTRALQATVPLLTGALISIDALMGEQQRPAQVLSGAAQRVLPGALADRLAA